MNDLETTSTEKLLKRRGELAAGAQLALLEGIPFDDSELTAVDTELMRRGVDLTR